MVTGENGEGDGVQTTGSGPENDTYADANNIFSSSYTTRTNRPFGKSPDNFLLTTETGFEEISYCSRNFLIFSVSCIFQ